MNKVAKNAAWIIGCKIAQSLLAFIIGMLTARYLGPSNYGLITYAASLVAFAAPIMQLGFSNIMVREIVDNPSEEGKRLGTAMLLSLISSVACIVGVTLFAAAANKNEPTTTQVCFLYSLVLLFQAVEHINYWFQAKYLSKYTSIISICAYVLVSAYKIHLLATRKSIYWFALTNALDALFVAFGAVVIYHKLGGQKLSFSARAGKQMFARSRHYIVSFMMVTVFVQTDKVMIKAMLGSAETGYYGAALTCAGITGFVFPAIIDSFRPFIFEGQKLGKDVFEHRFTMLYAIIIYLSLIQSVGIAVFSKLIVRIIYGVSYAPAAGALRIVVWYTTFSYLGAVRDIWILAKNEQNHLWKIYTSGAAANVILNTMLIPVMGIKGAALASLVTQFFTNVVTGFILKPIRENNAIMIRACNPILFVKSVRQLAKKFE